MLWRKEPPVVNDKGKVVQGGLFQHQREWWDLPNFIKALVTGYGGGKTYVGAKRSIAVALHNAPRIGSGQLIPHLAVSPSYKIAKRTTIPAIKSLLGGKQLLPGFHDLRWHFHKTDHEFTVLWRGREAKIWVASGDDPDGLRGPNVGSSSIDEPFIQAEEVFEQVVARTRHPDARLLEITLTGTPEQLNWGYDLCEGEKKDDYDVGVIHASTKENYVLREEYASTLERGYSERAAQAYVDGKFVSLQEGQIYYGFDERINVEELPDPGGELGLGMDFNVDPMAAVVFWHDRARQHIHIVDEIELPNADTEYMCSYVKENYRYTSGDLSGSCRVRVVYPDASGVSRSTKSPGGKSDFWYIRQAGFRIDAPPANPPIRDRENAVNGKFKPRSGKPTLTISPKCRRLKSYLIKHQHAEKHKPDQRAMSHLLDAMGYPVHRLYPIARSPSRAPLIGA